MNKGYVNAQSVRALARKKITTLANLFGRDLSSGDAADTQGTRTQIIAKLLSTPPRR
jgi:hypothetical protein